MKSLDIKPTKQHLREIIVRSLTKVNHKILLHINDTLQAPIVNRFYNSDKDQVWDSLRNSVWTQFQ